MILFPEERGESRYELWRFSNSNTIWESVSGKQSFPTEINRGESSYQIHYRRINYTEDNKELFIGTWINAEYNEYKHKLAKYICKPDGTWFLYDKLSDTEPRYFGTFVLTEKWIDSEGNVWYKRIISDIQSGHPSYELIKVSGSGNILERQVAIGDYSYGDYPSELYPNKSLYVILYRQ